MTRQWGCLAYYITANINKSWHFSAHWDVPGAAACNQQRACMKRRRGGAVQRALSLSRAVQGRKHFGTSRVNQKRVV